MTDLFIKSSAIISDCGKYRYRLDRNWGDGPKMGFIMLNPSTADANQDDPTIRRCIGFAKREGCGGIIIGNLLAYRATKPEAMLALDDATDAIGPEADINLLEIMDEVDGPLIAAWGAHWMAKDRAHYVSTLILGDRTSCLGKTQAGHPRHPLYVRADQPLISCF